MYQTKKIKYLKYIHMAIKIKRKNTLFLGIYTLYIYILKI